MARDADTWDVLQELDGELTERLRQAELAEIDDIAESRFESRRERSLYLIRSEERPTFFDYQSELLERMSELLRSGGTALLSLPTGAGKTRTAIGALLEARRQEDAVQVCWLAPTYELLEQAMSTAAVLWRQYGGTPDLSVSMSGAPDTEVDLWLATPQAVAARAKRGHQLGRWSGVIFDEAHQMAAPTFRAAVEALRNVSGARSLIGLSATPGRSSEGETDVLVELFGGKLLTSRLLGAQPVDELQRRGVLSKLVFRRLSKREAGLLGDVERLRVVLRACRHLARRNRRVLVFTSSVAGAEALSLALVDSDVAADWVSGSMSYADRQERIGKFADGRTQILANQRLLATGYDCPAVTDVIIQMSISSPVLFEQIVGRAARGPLTGGPSLSTVWQFDDHLKLHGLPQSYYRYRDYDWL